MRSKKTSGIYKIENIINNKVYVGSSVSIEDRWIRHKTDLVKGKSCSIKLQNSYNKHGVENFEFSILEECRIDNLIEREQYYINMYNSYNEGYNCCAIAGNTLGFSPSEETRNKIRISVSGDKNPFYGKKHTEESRAIMRESHKGQISGFKGKKFSEESKKKISDAAKIRSKDSYKWTEDRKKEFSKYRKGKSYRNGIKHSEETKEKIGLWNKGKIVSEESKRKLSQSKRNNKSIILQYDLNDNLLKEWEDLFSLRESGYITRNITRACNVNGRSGEYIWKFKKINIENEKI